MKANRIKTMFVTAAAAGMLAAGFSAIPAGAATARDYNHDAAVRTADRTPDRNVRDQVVTNQVVRSDGRLFGNDSTVIIVQKNDNDRRDWDGRRDRDNHRVVVIRKDRDGQNRDRR